MEPEILRSAMKRSISEVLEKMFFMPVDFPGTPEQEWADLCRPKKFMVAKLAFNGPFSGQFLFFIPEEMTSSLAAGFLGQDEQHVTVEHRADTVKEIVNMIAGNMFCILDNNALFNLEIPVMIEGADMEAAFSGSSGGIFLPVQTVDSSLGLQLTLC
ncbi:MAG: chemotaxis protein CheX [Desulfobacteraceae bacterium]|nr:MAG: chemotaxis protein CheX [Desulfobacteraceae bacterium]